MCSPPENTINENRNATVVKWDELGNIEPKSMNLEDYWSNRKKTSQQCKYEEIIKELQEIQDTMEKTRKFYWYYSLYKREVPTVEEALAEYVKQGLNTNSDINSKKRKSRFESCRNFIIERYDLSKCGFHLEDWDDNKEKYIKTVSQHIGDKIDVKWSKGSKSYVLRMEELALIYYAIHKSNEYDTNNNDRIIKNSFGYNSVSKVFHLVYGKGCHRAKCARILKILRQTGLIEKTGNYIVGIRGTCYRAM